MFARIFANIMTKLRKNRVRAKKYNKSLSICFCKNYQAESLAKFSPKLSFGAEKQRINCFGGKIALNFLQFS